MRKRLAKDLTTRCPSHPYSVSASKPPVPPPDWTSHLPSHPFPPPRFRGLARTGSKTKYLGRARMTHRGWRRLSTGVMGLDLKCRGRERGLSMAPDTSVAC